jgi:hypothetical protein
MALLFEGETMKTAAYETMQTTISYEEGELEALLADLETLFGDDRSAGGESRETAPLP